jgi:thiamine kinase-like enzyme
VQVFSNLFSWLSENLWEQKKINETEFKIICQQFYVDKTLTRLKKYSNLNLPEIVFCNGEQLPTANELMNKIDVKLLNSGKSYFIHGDLQPDNILYSAESNSFKLIDWRQDFAGRIDLGDIYYDFAKILAGLRINYQLIKNKDFDFSVQNEKCFARVPEHSNRLACEEVLKNRAVKFHLDFVNQ